MKSIEIKDNLLVKHPYFGYGKILNEVLIDGRSSGVCIVQFNKQLFPLDIACYYLTIVEDIVK